MENIRTCKECEASMDFKRGTSKAGKDWAGWFCSASKEHAVDWERLDKRQGANTIVKDVKYDDLNKRLTDMGEWMKGRFDTLEGMIKDLESR